MKFSIKKIWKNLKEKIQLKRGDEEVIAPATYYTTNASLGFSVGFILGVIVAILQLTSIPHDTQTMVANILFYSTLALGIAGNIYLLLPLLKAVEVPLWKKIVRPILGIVLFGSLLIAGMFAFYVLFVMIVLYLVLMLFLGSVSLGGGSSSSSSSNRSDSDDNEQEEQKNEEDSIWKYQTKDEFGNERKLKDWGFETYLDDEGHQWRKVDRDSVVRDD